MCVYLYIYVYICVVIGMVRAHIGTVITAKDNIVMVLCLLLLLLLLSLLLLSPSVRGLPSLPLQVMVAAGGPLLLWLWVRSLRLLLNRPLRVFSVFLSWFLGPFATVPRDLLGLADLT